MYTLYWKIISYGHFQYNVYIFGIIFELCYIQNHFITNNVIRRLKCTFSEDTLILFWGWHLFNDLNPTMSMPATPPQPHPTTSLSLLEKMIGASALRAIHTFNKIVCLCFPSVVFSSVKVLFAFFICQMIWIFYKARQNKLYKTIIFRQFHCANDLIMVNQVPI